MAAGTSRFGAIGWRASTRGRLERAQNRRTISREEIESRVLVALRDELMRRDLFEEFCREYVKELTGSGWSTARRSPKGGRNWPWSNEKSVNSCRVIKVGVSATSIKKELLELEAGQVELREKLEAPEMPEFLHPRMADVYREKVSMMCQALEHEESRLGATTAIRGLIEAILLEPDGDRLKITLKGDLAGC